MNKLCRGLAVLILCWPYASSAQHIKSDAAKPVVAVRVDQSPIVDGRGDDPAWLKATPFTCIDAIAEIKVTMKAIYTSDELFVLVTFPDDTENRAHKTLVWDDQSGAYSVGPQREDTFVVKWSMEPRPVDLTLVSEHSYKADIWYWKSHRTDHAGYADDKLQTYNTAKKPRAMRLISESGRPFYLTRSGDAGESAYKTTVHPNFIGDEVPLYELVKPNGSRADVRAKGDWRDDIWTVEFRRKLRTGQPDDVQFDPSQTYQFAVSRYEIAGRKKNPNIEQPNFGAGEVDQHFVLSFR